MRLLLDSHVVLWWLVDSDRLGERARAAIAHADEVFVSAATPWELGIKQSLGKLDLPDDLIEQCISGGFEHLPITAAHGEAAAALPLHHRDPFDRTMVSQAQLEALTLVTANVAIDSYEVDTLDAAS